MKRVKGIKTILAATLLTVTAGAQAVPGGGGIYDWWAGFVHFTGGSSRLAQGGSPSSCYQDLYRQKQKGITQHNETFSHFTYCTKSRYPKMYQLPMLVLRSDDSGNHKVLDDLEREYKIDEYREKVQSLTLRHQQQKLEQKAHYIKLKGSSELNAAEVEYIDMMGYLPLEAELETLQKQYRIEAFREQVKNILE